MVLIDFSSLSMRVIYSKYPKSEPSFETVRRHIIKSIRLHERGSYYGKIVICCDKKPYWRSQYFKYYKANRKRGNYSTEIGTITGQLIKEFKRSFPHPVLQVNHAEADDIIAEIVRNTKPPHLIVSRDSDFRQLLNEQVSLDNGERITLTREEAKEELLEKIILGDRSDSIPNILSDANTFMKPYKRQTPIRRNSLGSLMKTAKRDHRKRFLQNEKIIDLSKIPKDIKKSIKLEYFRQIKRTRPSMKDYLGRLGDPYLVPTVTRTL